MKLHSNIDAFFIQAKADNNKKNTSLEVGKIYKALLLSSKGNFSYFSIDSLVFKSNYINSSSKYIYLKVLENKDNYKFQLVKENIVFEQNQNNYIDLHSILKEKLPTDIFTKIFKNPVIIKDENNIEYLISLFQNSNNIFYDSKYHALFKIFPDRYMHLEYYEDQPFCFSFSLNFELEKGKFLIVKGYYKKNENKVNCNFITNSQSFNEKLFFASKELKEINSNFHWVCNQRFMEKIF